MAIFLEHGGPVIPAMLGVLKAGKIFVVIDPSFPAMSDYLSQRARRFG